MLFSAVNARASLETLRSVDVSAFFFEDHNDFLHQIVDGSVRGCTEKNACPSSLGVKVPHRSDTVITLTRETHTHTHTQQNCILKVAVWCSCEHAQYSGIKINTEDSSLYNRPPMVLLFPVPGGP